MRKIIFFLILLLFNLYEIFAQGNENGVLQGRVYNSKNNEPVPFASVVIFQTTIGSATNFDGEFKFTGIKPGFIKLLVSSVGFET
ncbi:MAG TPA: carboxypeptidase-like regulatory domain-containing protein, partial [Bacteroidales bacterium]|nr:carboxypeptidase-like regulatory domain-containing protein [Bacteroidales bacterium]